MQHFYDFFRNAASVRVVSSSSVSGQSQATKYISCIFEAKFFIDGGMKSATLLAHAVFASVNSSRHSNINRSRTQLSLTKCTTLPRHLELTMTAVKTGAVGMNQGH